MDTVEVLKTEGPNVLLHMLENRIKLNSANWSCLGTQKKIYANRPLCNIVRLGRGQGLWAPHSSSSQSYKFSLTSQVDIQKQLKNELLNGPKVTSQTFAATCACNVTTVQRRGSCAQQKQPPKSLLMKSEFSAKTLLLHGICANKSSSSKIRELSMSYDVLIRCQGRRKV